MQKLFVPLLCAMLTACAGFPGVYKIDIEQGNVITQELADQLRPGMTKRQVRFILGTALVQDPFNQDRWSYIYSMQPGGEEREQERLTVIFDDEDRLASFAGDITPDIDTEEDSPAESL